MKEPSFSFQPLEFLINLKKKKNQETTSAVHLIPPANQPIPDLLMC